MFRRRRASPPADRNHPLQLPTHESCNHGHNVIDELIGQLIGLRRGVVPESSKRRLGIHAMKAPDGGLMGGVNNLDIPAAVKRWIGAFHAALYGEPLPRETRFALEIPFPSATIEDGAITFQQLREEQHRIFVEVLKHQRMADSFDSVVCNNGKLRYECVWDQLDDWGWACVFGLDLYGWADLGDKRRFTRRGCAGSYILPERRLPAMATRARKFEVSTPNEQPLDPFGT
jgi:hypothetical protein